MIPKVIHYIWLGGRELPSSTLMIINNWHRKLPDYEIKRWDESNLPIESLKNENTFFKKCCDYKLWAFMSDYLRLWILYNKGGIYLDTDVEVLQAFDSFLDNKSFFGYEKGNECIGEYIGSGIIGSEKFNKTIGKLLNFYADAIWNEREYINTIIFKKLFIEDRTLFKDATIYPRKFFSPYSPYDDKENRRDVIEVKDTYAIHWYNSNWGVSMLGYGFLTTKYIKNPIFRNLLKIKRYVGYFRKGIK